MVFKFVTTVTLLVETNGTLVLVGPPPPLVRGPWQLNTSSLGLASGDRFGSSIATMSCNVSLGTTALCGSAIGDGSVRWRDYDGDPSTVDLAVGAPLDDTEDNNAGAL